MSTNGTLGLGGLLPYLIYTCVLGAIFFLTRYFTGHSRDKPEFTALLELPETHEARTLIFWILSCDSIR